MKTLITLKLKFFLLILVAHFTTTNMFAQPANDHIENAIDLSQGPVYFEQEDVDFTNATSTDDGGQEGCTTGVAGIWYKFTATRIGTVEARIWTNSQPIVLFYTAENENATSGQELTHIDQEYNQCENSNYSNITTEIGQTYYVYMKNNLTSDIYIDTIEIFTVPPNDLIENATNINGQENYSETDTHYLMATSYNDSGQEGCDSESSPSLWHKFTAEQDGEVFVEMSTPNDNTAIVIYSAENQVVTSGDELKYVDQPTNNCGPGNTSSITTEAGTTYYILSVTNLAWSDINITITETLSTSDNTIDGFTYYPNPVTNEINLSATTILDKVQINNIVGQLVLSEKLDATNQTIDLSALPTGMYVMNVYSEEKIESFKIIKK